MFTLAFRVVDLKRVALLKCLMQVLVEWTDMFRYPETFTLLSSRFWHSSL